MPFVPEHWTSSPSLCQGSTPSLFRELSCCWSLYTSLLDHSQWWSFARPSTVWPVQKIWALSTVICIPSDTGLTHITKLLLTKPTEKPPAYSCENESRVLLGHFCAPAAWRDQRGYVPVWPPRQFGHHGEAVKCVDHGTQIQRPAWPGVHGVR